MMLDSGLTAILKVSGATGSDRIVVLQRLQWHEPVDGHAAQRCLWSWRIPFDRGANSNGDAANTFAALLLRGAVEVQMVGGSGERMDQIPQCYLVRALEAKGHSICTTI